MMNDKKNEKQPRLKSLDALRGFDMLWILGLEELVVSLAAIYKDQPWLQWLSGQMHHPVWDEGCTLYDLIFPLFLFIAGVALPFSHQAQIDRNVSRTKIYFKLVRRLILLLAFCAIYNGGLAFNGIENTRFAGVLSLIGIGWFFAALIVMNFSLAWQATITAGIMLSYWAALEWIPVPDVGAGILTAKDSFAGWMDQQFLPGRSHMPNYDPEGIMPCFSAISTAMLGALTGQWLRTEGNSPAKKAGGLLLAGIGCMAVAWGWSYYLPFIKNLWSSSYALWAGGISMVLLSIFYTIIDVLGFTKWAFFFTVIGLNSITVYMARHLFDFEHTSRFFTEGLINLSPEIYHEALTMAAFIAIQWLFVYFLYRNKIFLKV